MKNCITLFAAGTIAMSAAAQDTLHAWNIFNVHDRIVYGNADQVLAPNVVPGSGGPGQTWVFTTVAFEELDTLTVASMTDVPPQYSAEFPQSNLAFYYGNNQNAFDLLHSNGQSLFIDGTASLNPNFGVLSQEFTNPLEYLNWPMYYGVSFGDTAYSSWKYPTTGQNDSAWEVTMIEMTMQVDAQGTLITSYGTYDILRFRRDYEYWVSYATHDPNTGWSSFSPLNYTTRVYEWWTDSITIGWLVASMMVNPANNAVQSYTIMTDYTVDVLSHAGEISFSLFPNPADQFIRVSGEEHSRWEIRDMDGRAVNSGVLRNKSEEIDISALASGVYVMLLTNENGASGSRKFVRW